MATLTAMVPTPMASGLMPMEDTPTPMESTTSASVMLRLRLSPRLMPLFCTALMATLTAMVPTPMASGLMPMEDTPTPMEPTTSASVMLRPSLRLMPLFCMALMATLTAMVPTPMDSGLMPMEDTLTPMEPTSSASVKLRLRLSPRLMPLFCMALMATLTAMVSTPMATGPMLMEDTPMLMELTPTTVKSSIFYQFLLHAALFKCWVACNTTSLASSGLVDLAAVT